jgi:ArsR family transcriptional regulator, arsenate/arsenite/antimonite-responsive transcriptional repressor
MVTYGGRVTSVAAGETASFRDHEEHNGGPVCVPLSISAPLGRDGAERLSRLLKAVADPTRLQLISLIKASPDGEACVCDLTAPLGLRQPTVSHHLKVLTEAGLVTRERRGTWMWYAMAPGALDSLIDLLR